MARQLQIKTCVADGDKISKPVLLEPGVHGGLYNIPEIRDARDYLRAHEECEAMWIRIGTRSYSLIVSNKDEPVECGFEI